MLSPPLEMVPATSVAPEPLNKVVLPAVTLLSTKLLNFRVFPAAILLRINWLSFVWFTVAVPVNSMLLFPLNV